MALKTSDLVVFMCILTAMVQPFKYFGLMFKIKTLDLEPTLFSILFCSVGSSHSIFIC